MKKTILSFLVAFCALAMVSCGNAVVDQINALVVKATEQTQVATSAAEVGAIATALQTEMNKIEAEQGGKLTLGKSVDESLAKYQEVATAKLAEFGLNLGE